MEKLEFFDDKGNKIGIRPREEIHRDGSWHQVVHCWITDFSGEEKWVYFQQRSFEKADFPGLYDISSAGHINPGESPLCAVVREIKEETGLEVQKKDLRYLGMIKEEICLQGLDDKEMSHVFWYDCKKPGFCPGEEVERMAKTTLERMRAWIDGQPLSVSGDGKVFEFIGPGQTCIHGTKYYQWILKHWGG